MTRRLATLVGLFALCALPVMAADTAVGDDAGTPAADNGPVIAAAAEAPAVEPPVDSPTASAVEASSCYASRTCWDGSSVSCSCPGTGSCSSSPQAGSAGGRVDCDCTPNPDYHYVCQCAVSCSSDAICRKPFACNNPWAECHNGCCLCD